MDIFQIVRRGTLKQYQNSIAEIDINIINMQGQSLLHEAITYKNIAIALNLLEKGIDVNIQDKKGLTTLHYLGFYPDTNLAKKIISQGGRLDIGDNQGNMPLWYAIMNTKRNYKLIELFIQNGAVSTIRNNAGRSALDMAWQFNDEKLLKLLNCNFIK